MLDKKICKRCLELEDCKWDDHDEKNWEKFGEVICPVDYHDMIVVKTKKEPPKECPFVLEHLMKKQNA